MKGFRPSFYNPDPALHSIEILAWASDQVCFTLTDITSRFADRLSFYADPVHEASERLRKLARSGMIVCVDQTRLGSLEMGRPQRLSIQSRLREIAEKSLKRRGRPARLYIVTHAGLKHVEGRGDDLRRIAEDRERKARDA